MTEPTIDSQVHAYEVNSPERPWIGTLAGPDSVTGDEMVAAMDAVGVDGALLVSPWSLYRFDASYALQVDAQHPGRFGLIKPFDPQRADVEEELAEWAALPSTVGVRLMLWGETPPPADDPGLNRIIACGAKHGLPVNILAWGKLPLVHELIQRHPDTQIVIDHVGLLQPFYPPVPDDPFADVPQVCELAQYPNVAIKISGACTLSYEPFPFPDIWAPLARVFDAFGIERCLWGTDWTRAVNLVTYADGVEAFRLTDTLSEGEKARLMGGSLRAIYNWSPAGPA